MLGLQKFFLEWDQINQKTLARPTACTKKTQVRRFLLHTKATEPAQLTYLVVQKYLNFLSDYYSPNTLGNHKASISSFCTYLLRCQAIPYHPCRGAALPRAIVSPPDYLTDAECHRFIMAAEMHGVSLAIKIAIGTGLRRRELGNLQWGDIDLTRKLIQVINKKTFLVKNRKCRTIPIMDRLYADLSNLHEAIHPEPAWYVITSRHQSRSGQAGRKPLGARTMDKMLLPVKNIFPGRVITWRILRHTFASLLVQNGVSYYKVAAWLGNDPAICAKYYCNAGQRFDPDINRLADQESPQRKNLGQRIL